MSKKDKQGGKGKSENSEKKPWEQPIYDTDYEVTGSRSQHRKKKSGNVLFVKLLLTMLALMAVIIIGWLVFLRYDSSNSTTPATLGTSTSSSQVTSDTTTSSQETAATESSENMTETSESESDATDSNDTDSEAVYATVQAGDGLYVFAQRNGVSLETVYELNDLNANSVIMPGDELRIS
ncbi:SAG1386/EF1546 family surface-associated protein [Enterococcus sp. HY326]|uniref:SAG1386/EF1546 family surface-associated protein n=1 Tax=Enterococcus sp. HY326 TaxID=2971265 RepID=UPI0022407935|nr:SAG1386/EF1546 family surface-associated protein [Enterococcus sp. HY326]